MAGLPPLRCLPSAQIPKARPLRARVSREQLAMLSPQKDKYCTMPLTGWILNRHIRRIKHWSGGSWGRGEWPGNKVSAEEIYCRTLCWHSEASG